MSFTLGKDLGFVMAKGVVFGVIGCVTVLPSLILVLDKPLQKTRHRSLIPPLHRVAQSVTRVFPVFLAALAVVHLISCWRGDDDLRKPTKVALMPVVALAYLAFSCTPSLWVVAGLLFGCLGDLFLLWPLKKKFFVLGTSSFFLVTCVT